MCTTACVISVWTQAAGSSPCWPVAAAAAATHTGVYALRHCPQSAKKRYKVTGSGKVMVRRSGKQHLNEKLLKAKKKALRRARCCHLALPHSAAACGGRARKAVGRRPRPDRPLLERQALGARRSTCRGAGPDGPVPPRPAAPQQGAPGQQQRPGEHPRLPALRLHQVSARRSTWCCGRVFPPASGGRPAPPLGCCLARRHAAGCCKLGTFSVVVSQAQPAINRVGGAVWPPGGYWTL